MRIQPLPYSINTNRGREAAMGNKSSALRCICSADTNAARQNSISDVFYYPVSFGKSAKRGFSTDRPELAEKSGDFVISHICDVPCPACGKKMLNSEKFGMIEQELSQLQPDEYLDCLAKYKEYMRPVEESVFDEIYALSQKPEASKDIRTLLVQLRDTKLPILQDVQLNLIKKMRRLARTLPEDEKEVLLAKIKQLQVVVKKNKSESPFRRKIMIDRISKIKISNPRHYEKLQNIAKSFPTSADMNSAWIVKYSGKNKHNEDWSSFDIACRFLFSSVANTDHIIAYDIDNNHDDISNYMSMHKACNERKSNKPFLQWLNEDKTNRKQYIQDYFDYIDLLIQNGIIKNEKYQDYVAYASQTVYEASKGQIEYSQNKRTLN